MGYVNYGSVNKSFVPTWKE